MTLQVGVNSYVTVEEADTYFLTRYGFDDWANLEESSKESALISATSVLELYCAWAGEKTDPEQALSFPRNGDTEVPQAIKNGECELAVGVVTSGTIVPSNEAALTELTAGDVTLKWVPSFVQTNTLYNSYVRSLLDPQCQGGGSSNNSVRRT